MKGKLEYRGSYRNLISGLEWEVVFKLSPKG